MTVRIAWLIAATLLLARVAEWVIDALRELLGWYHLSLPGRPYPFTSYLNAATLLATSFALVCTAAQFIEGRFASRFRAR